MNLQGRTAIVTGGGTGIGRAVVKALAEAGAAVMAVGRRREVVDEVATELRMAGKKAWSLSCDVADPKSVDACAAEIPKLLGVVDILVNSAGIAYSESFRKVSLDDWERHLRVNATGAFLCAKAFLPLMLERKWGRIVTVASVAGLSSGPYLAAYSASKHAVIGLTRSLAAEVADKGVTVNAVCPGFVDTDLTRASVDRIVEKTGMTREQAQQKLAEQSPQKRLMTAEEVAFAVTFLCDERARGINGQAIVIDGGALLA